MFISLTSTIVLSAVPCAQKMCAQLRPRMDGGGADSAFPFVLIRYKKAWQFCVDIMIASDANTFLLFTTSATLSYIFGKW